MVFAAVFVFPAGCDKGGAMGSGPDSVSEVDEEDPSENNASGKSQAPKGDPQVDACAHGPCVVIPEGSALCQAFMFYRPDFGAGMAMKARIQLEAGEFPIDDLRLRGKILYDGKSHAFEAFTNTVELSDHGTASELASELQVTSDSGAEFSIYLGLLTDELAPHPRFTLDRFESFDRADIYKEFRVMSDESLKIMGGIKRSLFDACELESTPTNTFSFELEDGAHVELETRSVLTLPNITSQYGLLKQAQGTIAGERFTVSQWDDLYYGADAWSNVITAPALGIRLPKSGERCGYGFYPNGEDDTLYRAFELNCDYSFGRELRVLKETIPKGFLDPDGDPLSNSP